MSFKRISILFVMNILQADITARKLISTDCLKVIAIEINIAKRGNYVIIGMRKTALPLYHRDRAHRVLP